MIKPNKLFMLLLLVVAIASISCVCASDANATIDDMDEKLSIDDASMDVDEITQEIQEDLPDDNMDDSGEVLTSINEDSSNVLTDNGTDSKRPIIITANEKTVEYNSGNVADIKVVDKETGNTVSGAYILVTMFTDSTNSKNYLFQTNNDGKISFAMSLSVGKHKMIVTSADKRYSSDNVTSYVTVTKANAVFKAPAVTKWITSGKNFIVTVYNSKTNQRMYDTKVNIKVYITSSKYYDYSGRTDENGNLAVSLESLKVGIYKVVVSPADSSNYAAKAIKSSIKIKTKLTYKVKKVSVWGTKGFEIYAKDKLKKKYVNGVKFKLKIYTGKKYKTLYLVSGYDKATKRNGEFGYGTNMLSVGTHKVVITPVTKGYTGKVTAKIVVTKKAKKNYKKWLAYDTKGKSHYNLGGKKFVV